MQTALQKLKSKLETQKEFYGTRFPQFILWIDELLKFEKETIENAFKEGYKECLDTEVHSMNDIYSDVEGKDYYKQTFKND